MIHGDHRGTEAGVRVYCQQHGWIDVQPTNWAIHFTREHNAGNGCLPTITNPADAVALARALASASSEGVAVFWDRGWGGSRKTTEITIIVDGDGQNPRAAITRDCYNALEHTEVISPNSLITFKARRVHYFAPDVIQGTRTPVLPIYERSVIDLSGVVLGDFDTDRFDWRGTRAILLTLHSATLPADAYQRIQATADAYDLREVINDLRAEFRTVPSAPRIILETRRGLYRVQCAEADPGEASTAIVSATDADDALLLAMDQSLNTEQWRRRDDIEVVGLPEPDRDGLITEIW